MTQSRPRGCKAKLGKAPTCQWDPDPGKLVFPSRGARCQPLSEAACFLAREGWVWVFFFRGCRAKVAQLHEAPWLDTPRQQLIVELGCDAVVADL